MQKRTKCVFGHGRPAGKIFKILSLHKKRLKEAAGESAGRSPSQSTKKRRRTEAYTERKKGLYSRLASRRTYKRSEDKADVLCKSRRPDAGRKNVGVTARPGRKPNS